VTRRLTYLVLILMFAGFTVRARAGTPRSVVLSHTGLPEVTYQFDSEGRLSTVLINGSTVVTYQTGASLPTVHFGRWTVETTAVDLQSFVVGQPGRLR